MTKLEQQHLAVQVPFKQRYGNFIGGQWVEPKGGKYFDNITPITGHPFCEIPRSDKDDVEAALDAAHAAKEAWGKTSVTERARILNLIADRMEQNLEVIAYAETWDNGKPIRETLNADVPLAIDHFRYFASCIRAQEGSMGEIDNDTVSYQFHEPLGVVGQIIPWNFPLLMAAWKIAPALACGNTVVIKPSKTTSLTLVRLAQIFQEAELPEGVVNVITGVGETGTAIVKHPDVNKIAFTGSTEIGKQLAQMIVGTDKRITLELGGKAANIVFEDAPIDQAIEGIIAGIYFNMGHVCCAGSRLLVQESIYPKVVKKLRDRIQTLRIGNPLDKNTDIGAINNKPQLEKIRELVQSGADEGAEIVQPVCQLPERGYWYPPTFLTGVTASHRVAQEEIFGPVLSVMTFRTPEEAVERANNTPYGLSAGVWTDKGSKIFKIVNQLRAGVVWANTYNKFDPTSPFGGYKESGFGREGGVQGLAAYCRLD